MIVSAWRSARSISARRSRARSPSSASMAPRSQSRRSVATWSLRERAVCSLLPASPASAVSRCSMLRWTSSSSRDHANSPRSISPSMVAIPRSIAARSAPVSTPTADSMRAWASDPAISTAASRRSKSTDAVKRLTRSATGSLKRPDQPPAAGGEGLDGTMAAMFPGRGRSKNTLAAPADATGRRCSLPRPPRMPTMGRIGPLGA